MRKLNFPKITVKSEKIANLTQLLKVVGQVFESLGAHEKIHQQVDF